MHDDTANLDVNTPGIKQVGVKGKRTLGENISISNRGVRSSNSNLDGEHVYQCDDCAVPLARINVLHDRSVSHERRQCR